MEYKGYTAEVVYDEDAREFHGSVKGILDVVTFVATTAEELRQEFHDSVDDYLDYCAELGREPDKPFSGKFNVRLTQDLHRRVFIAAERLGISINAFVNAALEKATESRENEGLTIVASPGKSYKTRRKKQG
ncbi:type II toxin-antitoxin system HicB family antitoxin [bacterium]|nr:type II toxin-antitoxin system HicB family antitoxin [bacterium]